MATILNEIDSKKLLESVGISIPKGYFVPIDDLTDGIYRAINFIGNARYVIKVVSPTVVHKSDIGGVILNVEHDDIFESVTQLINNVIKLPNSNIDGIYIQSMIDIKNSIELLIGVKTDPQFGQVIIVGSGGIFTEIYKDISMRVLPINESDIIEMLSETKIYKVLNGYRSKVYNIKKVIDTIMKVSLLVVKEKIDELDINPLLVSENEVVALDARIKL